MTREQNIFLAKKLFVELVYNTAYIEGCNVTFPQTQTIVDGGIVNNVAVSDIQTILNLRDGWNHILESIDMPITVDYICDINALVSRNESLEWGVLRTGLVGISGTDFRPSPPVRDEVEEQLDRITSLVDPKKQAIAYFCYGVRNQLFWDGNKRTSTIIASKILIQHGEGVLTIDKANALAFNEALLDYYDTANSDALEIVLRKCIKTMELGLEKSGKK